MSEFILMLTHNDETMSNAHAIYREIKDSGVRHVGFKDVGLPTPALLELTRAIQANGHYAYLEVVALTEEDELRSAESALHLGVDYLIGGSCIDKVMKLIEGSGIKYFPYVGQVIGHPAKLGGSVESIVAQARSAEARGVDGINLLAYRYLGDGLALAKAVKEAIHVPLICAGTVDTLDKVRELCELGVWAFTIGGAVMTCKLVPHASMSAQIQAVLEVTKRHSVPA